MNQPAPRKKQLAVSKRIRVPASDATWDVVHAFARTYDASFHFSSSTGDVVQLAYRPVFAALDAGEQLGGELGIARLRAALWFQARSDQMAGATDFSSPEVERLYRGVCAELHARTGGWVDDQS